MVVSEWKAQNRVIDIYEVKGMNLGMGGWDWVQDEELRTGDAGG